MKPFCEIIVSDILPAVRALITKELIQNYGFSQIKVAKILGITQPAISQYRKELRGSNVKPLQSNKRIISIIKKTSAEIASEHMGPTQLHKNLCEICKEIRKEKIVCKIHDELYPDVSCDFCFG